jgi:hypothetical protein
MALFPFDPLPSQVSAPAWIDPMHQYETDAGYQIRRSKHSRPRRRYLLEWFGKTTEQMRGIRDFLLTTRLGALPFSWEHPTALDFVPTQNTTPVILSYTHGLVTGSYVVVRSHPTSGINGIWQATRLNSVALALNGSLAGGVAYCNVTNYLPNAVAIIDQEAWASPTKLIGPEQLGSGTYRSGYFSWAVLIEEIF